MNITLILFIIGLAIGSFLNVVAYRYPSRDYTGRSKCPHCGTQLRWHDLIPVFSFLFLLGKCRYCGQKLSRQYPIVELAAGFIMAGQPPLIWLLASFVLLLIAAIDFRLGIIPDRLTIFLALFGLALIATGAGILASLGGAAAGLTILGSLFLFSKGKAMGMGDVKLAGALGLLFGWPKILLVLGAAFILGGVFAAALLIAKRKSMKDAVPFGPFLAAASLLVIFFGDAIIKWYF